MKKITGNADHSLRKIPIGLPFMHRMRRALFLETLCYSDHMCLYICFLQTYNYIA